MMDLQKLTNLPIALVRAFLEISVVCSWLVFRWNSWSWNFIFAFGIGPCVALGLFLVNRLFN